MKQTKVSLITVVFGAFFWLLPSTADAAKPKTVTVACDNDAAKDQAAINKALGKLKSGDTLLLTGTCKANVSGIPGGVTVDGGGNGSCGEASGAKIEAADATRSVVSHGGSGNVTIKGLIIKGIYGREMFDTWYKMITMLQSGLNIAPVITHEFSASDYQQAFDMMRSGESGKVILDWEK